jgi:hypothetical protein
MTKTTALISNLGRLALEPFRERGFVQTLKSVRVVLAARRRERDEAFDALHGTDTGRTMSATDLTASGADVPPLWRYYPTLRESFTRIMAAVPARLEDFVFVDLGSGKGRVVLMASEHPFRRVVGVELAPALHRVALQNVQRYRSDSQRCRAFELRCEDAAAWQPPPEPLLVYLFQPFPVDVLDAVLANLRAAAQRSGAEVIIAYLNPLFHRRVVADGTFRVVHYEKATRGDAFDWAIYSNHAAEPGPRGDG